MEKIDLIFGSEAASYTNAKDIKVANNILEPYNKAILEAVNLGVDAEWILNSGNLNWIATATQKSDSTLSAVYLSKIPYTSYALDGDTDNYNFLDGLEQRYGVDWYGDRGSREKILFNKLNDLGKSETKIFTQAVDEMKGYEYSNTQHRIKETTDILSKEFEYLRKDWRNPSKQNNKIKVFGQKNEYKTDTAGIIDYTSNAYGVAYVHEDETVKMGDSQGWYAGAVKNHFKFEDLGGSRENQTMIKAGLFKTMSPANDHNGSLRWTVAADMFGGIDEMKRRYWIVDDIFNARSDYYSYGTSLKTELEYDIRLSERAHLRPYGALKMEYGKFTNIKEDDGEIRLKIDSNDYFSVKPEIGAEFKYIQPLALRTQLSVGLSAAFENELGRLDDVNNKAKVRYTAADWYNLRNEKENKRGNGKFDLNIGLDNTRFGMTLNVGYDTNGKNIRSGIGFRAIY